jgi:FkbM family methyltransferase
MVIDRARPIEPIDPRIAARWLKNRFGPPEAQIRAASRPLRFVIERTAAWPRRARAYARWAAVRVFSGPKVELETDWGCFIAGHHDQGLLHPVFAEPLETAVINRLVEPGMTVVDVGANRGWFTVLLSALVGPTGTVIAVEPDPQALQNLRVNVAANPHCRNVSILECAVGARPEHAQFVSESEPEISHLARDDESGTFVEVRTLASIVERPDFVKIDVEGAEEGVVRGLGDARPILQIECERHLQERYGSSPEAVIAELHGYSAFRLCWDHGRPEPFATSCEHGPNVLCLPEEDAAKVLARVFREYSTIN